MSIIEGVTVDWKLSPRIINMPAPFGEPTEPLTIEDLNDTLQDIEADEKGIAFPKLRDTSGKEAGVVALTMLLLNVQIKFENTGTPRVCKISGGNLFAIDENGDDMCPIAYNSNITASYAQSTAATMIAAIAEWTQAEKDSILANIALIRQIEAGRWQLKDSQLIFYKEDNKTEIMRFNLLNKDGQPAEKNVMERVRV